jgi:hypothetical protein
MTMTTITITAPQASTLATLCEGGDILVSRQGTEEPHFRISPDGRTHVMDL